VIRENIERIKARIVSAGLESAKPAENVTLVAVVKNRSAGQIQEVLGSGIIDIGENKVQEAKLHRSALAGIPGLPAVKWHMIGHLQTNKARDAVRFFDLIHSVDSPRLAEELNKQAAGINKVQDILIEVNTSAEQSKSGVSPDGLTGLAKAVVALKNLRLLGLMTMAPAAGDPEKARGYFRQLRGLRDRLYELRVTSYELRELSMGMSDDFQAAVGEGATIVRIGRAVFEGTE